MKIFICFLWKTEKCTFLSAKHQQQSSNPNVQEIMLKDIICFHFAFRSLKFQWTGEEIMDCVMMYLVSH